ncbi:MAG TPA: polysaccharide deacetylase family protein [Gemmatimonadaceae bacterium]|nr:polysaccharide deacetylase family protein [Gemmatimonadaceae bacterium]
MTRPPAPAPGWRRMVAALSGAVTGVRTTEAVAALTFDDGPHPVYTPPLLDLLDRHAARATFFLVGEAAARHPALVREIAARGHAVGNHSWSHPSFTMIPGGERRRQLHACRRALAPYGAPLFRPPYGHHSVPARLDALWCGHEVIGWSHDSHDWCEADEDVLADALERGIRPGSIVLLHDAIHDQGRPTLGPVLSRAAVLDRSATLAALDRVLRHIGDAMRFLTVPELLRHGPPVRQS